MTLCDSGCLTESKPLLEPEPTESQSFNVVDSRTNIPQPAVHFPTVQHQLTGRLLTYSNYELTSHVLFPTFNRFDAILECDR